MSKFVSTIVLMLFVGGVVFLTAKPASAGTTFGFGPGCSAIEGLDVTTDLTNGDTFEGRIGTTGVSGVNKNNKPADDLDGDGCTDSLEECINSALVGFCSDVDAVDCSTDADAAGTENLTYTPGSKTGPNANQQEFEVTFQDVSNCAITACSDRVENETCDLGTGLCDSDGVTACAQDSDCFDGLIDYPDDPDCDSFSDNDENS